ncbi:HAD superfamily hydrolase (TIGR01549 family) [Chromohalobacter marismortui]|uniref:phosphoglycolate phosphatase n=1 Tax=Chromohalobacter marismortui TaxID=42055 RepID=A0A4R7NMP5_9GAMM|nr:MULTISPECIES: HAD family hydrolase [Chromohalobacter]MCI0509725.1 HAD hydrolase-like protein [Chromohalobacter sp.]MCI0593312.1 HAD hydrolase-like protein [Chromohalobacter sp.]TDU21947.1 HAD superfamily hydrolase (TIGR01549 family) [Chromohalobacter marismortui]
MANVLESHFDALVFDCDGVILDSASLKRSAFAEFYRDQPPALYQAILAYLSRGGGQPRDVKFHHIEAHILGRSINHHDIRALSSAFSRYIEDKVTNAPPLPGAIEFLERWCGRIPLYLLSATPQQELRRVIDQRQLTAYFNDVLGAPPDKTNGLNSLIATRQHDASRTVMVGDSYNDYRAARSNNTHFIGIKNDESTSSPFPKEVLTQLDLQNLDDALASLPISS